MKFCVTLFFVSVLFFPLRTSAQCGSPSTIHSFIYDNKSYEVVKENATWTQAAACAVSRGGKLVEINTAAEQYAVYTQLLVNASIVLSRTIAPDGGGAAYVWLGGNDMQTEGAWFWDGANTGNGTQFWQGISAAKGGGPVNSLYSNWGNEPDNYGGATGPGQDGLAMALTNWPLGTAGQWNDISTSNTIYYVVEHPGIIPVELMYFRAEHRADAIRLHWSTAAETNNLGWMVERRDHGGMWTDLGFVTGSGTTSQARYYSFDDASPQLPAPIEYRIRQIDYDGSTTYSNVLRIESEDLPSEILLEANYPNPFTEKTTIAFTLETSRDATLIITDITGREIRRIGNVSNGRAGRHEVSIPADDLPAGMYVYRLESGPLIRRGVMLLIR